MANCTKHPCFVPIEVRKSASLDRQLPDRIDRSVANSLCTTRGTSDALSICEIADSWHAASPTSSGHPSSRRFLAFQSRVWKSYIRPYLRTAFRVDWVRNMANGSICIGVENCLMVSPRPRCRVLLIQYRVLTECIASVPLNSRKGLYRTKMLRMFNGLQLIAKSHDISLCRRLF